MDRVDVLDVMLGFVGELLGLFGFLLALPLAWIKCNVFIVSAA